MSHTWAWIVASTPFMQLLTGLLFLVTIRPSVQISCGISILWVVIVVVFIFNDMKGLKQNGINIHWGWVVGGCVYAFIYLLKRKKLTNYGSPFVLSLVGGILQFLVAFIPSFIVGLNAGQRAAQGFY
jgi:hypothetical protein